MSDGRAKQILKTIGRWIPVVLLTLIFVPAGWAKFSDTSGWAIAFRHWGYPDWFRIVIGIAELTSMALLLVPRFASYGASLFVVVMLGAIYTHATHNESSRLPFILFLLALSLIIAFTRRPGFLRKLRKPENVSQ